MVEPDLVVDTISALHPGEREELTHTPAERRPAVFTRCWARKEAYLKAVGTGLCEAPSTTYVGTGPEPARHTGVRVWDLPTPPGLRAALALLAPDPSTTPERNRAR